MTVKDLSLEGLKLISNTQHYDYRGYFHVTHNSEEFKDKVGDYNFVQENESMSHEGVLRGLHYQYGKYSQAKLVRVIQGSVVDVVVDIRVTSPTFGKHLMVELDDVDKCQLMIPRGFAHGFLTLENNTIFSYKVDNVYNPSYESGIIFSDFSLGIDWNRYNTRNLITSMKDLELPKFSDLIF